MDDFNDDLWGEDDIDEAMLIEASQQVEAEAFKNVSCYYLHRDGGVTNVLR